MGEYRIVWGNDWVSQLPTYIPYENGQGRGVKTGAPGEGVQDPDKR